MVDTADSLRIGALLTEAGIITPQGLEERLELSKTIGQPIGQILLQSGDLTKYQLICTVQVQSLILDGALSRSTGVKAISAICKESADFGDALAQAGIDNAPPVTCRLGELLLEAQLLSNERLLQALHTSFETLLPLGQTLVREKFLRPDVIAKALTLQIKIRSGTLSRDAAIEQLRVPLDVSDTRSGGADDTIIVKQPNGHDSINNFLWKKIQSIKWERVKEKVGKPDDLIGEMVADKYEVVGFIGAGGMSLVYLVRHTLLDKVYALKIMQPHHQHNEEMSRRFSLEARTISSIDHPNVVTVHDFGITDTGIMYLVMDYIHGKSLAEIIKADARLSVEDALPIFIQACNALQLTHSKGIIHRDLKPSNIMLINQPNAPSLVKIVDFGIAKLLAVEEVDHQRITKSGELLGSPMYMSPEHCLGKSLDARSDIYSLACVMYECLSGSPPFKGATVYEIFQKQISAKPDPLTEFIPSRSVCKSLESIIFSCLDKEPQVRFQSMTKLRESLETVSRQRLKTGLFRL